MIDEGKEIQRLLGELSIKKHRDNITRNLRYDNSRLRNLQMVSNTFPFPVFWVHSFHVQIERVKKWSKR